MENKGKKKGLGVAKGLAIALVVMVAPLAWIFTLVGPWLSAEPGGTLSFTELAREFTQDLADKRYGSAYLRLSPRLRTGMTQRMFEHSVRRHEYLSRVKLLSLSHRRKDGEVEILDGTIWNAGGKEAVRFDFVPLGEGWLIDGIRVAERSAFPPPGAKAEAPGN